MNLLFVCNQGQNRSRTGAELLKDSVNTQYTGLYSESPLKKSQMQWADIILVMEDHQREEISKRFPKEYMEKRIISLDIPDYFHYNQPELIKLLKEKISLILSIPQIVS